MNPLNPYPPDKMVTSLNNSLSPHRHKMINNYVITMAADTLDADVIRTSVARALTIQDERAMVFYDGVFSYLGGNASISFEHQYKSSRTRTETRYEFGCITH